jgi:hypothetical protein
VKLSLDFKKSEMKGVNDRVEEFVVKQLKCGSKAVSSYELALQTCQLVKVSNVAMNRARIFKLLRGPGFHSKESILPDVVGTGPVRLLSYSVPSPHRLFKNSSGCPPFCSSILSIRAYIQSTAGSLRCLLLITVLFLTITPG